MVLHCTDWGGDGSILNTYIGYALTELLPNCIYCISDMHDSLNGLIQPITDLMVTEAKRILRIFYQQNNTHIHWYDPGSGPKAVMPRTTLNT